MWLIRLTDFEAPQKLRPDFYLLPKERDIMTHEELTISVAIASWKNTVGRADKVFSILRDEQFLQEVAPGRNRIIYILGHLTAVHDGLHTILGLGEQLYPDFEPIFISKPDKAIKTLPSIPELKKSWTDVNHSLLENFAKFSPVI
jgi:hypothetical protein